MSLTQVTTLHHSYKLMFKDQINVPSAENNHIINFNMKLGNYITLHHIMHSLLAGSSLFAFKAYFGERVERITLNYLGQRKAYAANIVLYLFIFFYGSSWLDSIPRLNINYLINVREFNGEIFATLCAKHFPEKINMMKYK